MANSPPSLIGVRRGPSPGPLLVTGKAKAAIGDAAGRHRSNTVVGTDWAKNDSTRHVGKFRDSGILDSNRKVLTGRRRLVDDPAFTSDLAP